MLNPQFAADLLPSLTATITATPPPYASIGPGPTSVKPIPTVVPTVPIFEKAGHAGKITFWVGFVVFLLSTIIFTGLSYRVPVQKRHFHILTTFITLFSTLFYYAQATGSGFIFTHFLYHEHHKHDIPDTTEHIFRQVFWAHYADAIITSTLILLNLSLLAGLSGANILVTVVTNVIGVFTSFEATWGRRRNSTQWGWYTISIIAYLVVAYQLIIPGRRSVKAKANAQTGSLFVTLSGYILILWALYLIVAGVSDGARKWTVDTGIISYAVLDILSKPVFGFWLLFAHGKNIAAIDGFWSHGLAAEGAVRLDDDEA